MVCVGVKVSVRYFNKLQHNSFAIASTCSFDNASQDLTVQCSETCLKQPYRKPIQEGHLSKTLYKGFTVLLYPGQEVDSAYLKKAV